jgi:hypothetical protein
LVHSETSHSYDQVVGVKVIPRPRGTPVTAEVGIVVRATPGKKAFGDGYAVGSRDGDGDVPVGLTDGAGLGTSVGLSVLVGGSV